MTPTRTVLHSMGATALALSISLPATAQSNRPVTVIVPFAAGGGTDITTRAMQQGMSEALGANVVVKNSDGAGGTIGVSEAARARPNGQTVAMAPVGPLTTQPHLRQLPYNIDSFDYICLAYSAPTVIAVPLDSPFETLEDLVAFGKENPGELTFAVQAIGSIPHIAGLGLADAAGIEMTFLPVNGDGPALKALLDGTADLFIPHVSFYSTNSSQVRSLAMLQKDRLKELPDLVTAAEQGYNLNFPIWGGIVAPAGLEAEAKTNLEEACSSAIASGPFQERMVSLNQPSAYMGSVEFEAFVREKYEDNRALLEKAGLLAK